MCERTQMCTEICMHVIKMGFYKVQGSEIWPEVILMQGVVNTRI